MKKIKIIPILLILCTVFAFVSPSAYASDMPAIEAEAILIADLNSTNILYEKNMDQQRSPASLTKMMTILLAVEAVEAGTVNLDDVITAGSDCRTGMDDDSSTADIYPGEQMTFEDLMYCAMVKSANEACNIIAVAVSGSIQEFVNDMNRRAREIGCTNTHFSDTNGLTNDDHYTTAYDLYVIAREGMSHPLFHTLATCKYYVVGPTNQVAEERYLHSSNALMTEEGTYGQGYLYDGAAGVKTGFTRKAGYCLVSTAHKGDLDLLCVVLGCRGPFAVSPIDAYGNFTETIKLYNWAFDSFAYRTLITAGQELATYPVELAAEGTTVTLRSMSEVTLLLPTDLTTEDIDIRVQLNTPTLQAPIKEDTELGSASINIKGVTYANVKLVTFDNIEMNRAAKIKATFKSLFSSGIMKIAFIILAAALLIYVVLVARYNIMKKKHVQNRKAAAARNNAAVQARARQQSQMQSQVQYRPQATNGQQQNRPQNGMQQPPQGGATKIIRDSETANPYDNLKPRDTDPDKMDLDELIRSLGLDKK